MKFSSKLALIAVIAALTLAVGCSVLGNPDPCDRTQAMRDALEDATGRDCDLITDDDLADVRRLGIRDEGELKGNDFADLSNLQSLSLYGSDLSWDVIGDLESLIALSLGIRSDVGISALPPGVFDGLTNLQTLDLGGSNLSELPPGVFDGLTNLQTLDLRDNNLSELPAGLFDNLNNLSELHLDGNPGYPFKIHIIGVCGRTPAVRAALEDIIGQNCAGITDPALTRVATLRLNNLRELSPGVFDGLINLQELDLI